ncbi:hypothetical protein J7K28_04925 [Candidatus Aerophobetes bacterium]|nr:hypothetical protein [Candidatus Aerophobetes bacterium]
MKKWLEVIGGAIAVVIGIWLIVIFAPQVLTFLEGIVGIAVGGIGGIVLAIGISELKEGVAEKAVSENKKQGEESEK